MLLKNVIFYLNWRKLKLKENFDIVWDSYGSSRNILLMEECLREKISFVFKFMWIRREYSNINFVLI